MSRPAAAHTRSTERLVGSRRASRPRSTSRSAGRKHCLATQRGGQELGGVEGVAARPLHDRGEERVRERVGGVRDEQPLDVLGRQRLELQHGAGEAGREPVQMVAGSNLVAPIRHEHENVPLGDRMDEVGDEIQRRLVGPVEVFEHEHDRVSGSESIEDREHLLEEAQAVVGPTVLVARYRRVRGQLGDEPGQLAQSDVELRARDLGRDRAQRVDERKVREPGADELDGTSPQHARAARAWVLCELGDEPRLADPGRARDQHGAAVTVPRRVERPHESRQLVDAAREPEPWMTVGGSALRGDSTLWWSSRASSSSLAWFRI